MPDIERDTERGGMQDAGFGSISASREGELTRTRKAAAIICSLKTKSDTGRSNPPQDL